MPSSKTENSLEGALVDGALVWSLDECAPPYIPLLYFVLLYSLFLFASSKNDFLLDRHTFNSYDHLGKYPYFASPFFNLPFLFYAISYYLSSLISNMTEGD